MPIDKVRPKEKKNQKMFLKMEKKKMKDGTNTFLFFTDFELYCHVLLSCFFIFDCYNCFTVILLIKLT